MDEDREVVEMRFEEHMIDDHTYKSYVGLVYFPNNIP